MASTLLFLGVQSLTASWVLDFDGPYTGSARGRCSPPAIQVLTWLLFVWCWGNWISVCRWMKIESCLWPWTQVNSKEIKVLSVSTETPRRKSGVILQVVGSAKDFLNTTLVTQETFNWLWILFAGLYARLESPLPCSRHCVPAVCLTVTLSHWTCAESRIWDTAR